MSTQDKAEALRAEGDYQGAIEEYAEALTTQPNDSETWIWMMGLKASLLDLFRSRQANDYEHVVQRIAQRISTADPQGAFRYRGIECWVTLGEHYEKLGDLEKASHAYREAACLDATSIDAWTRLGNVYSQTNRSDEAIRALHRAVHLMKEGDTDKDGYTSLDPHFQTVVLAFERLQTHTRIEDTLDIPLDPLFWFELAATWRHLNQPTKEVHAREQILRVLPGEAHIWADLSSAYERAGQTAKAIQAAEEATRLAPGEANIWYFLGKMYDRLDNERAKVISVYEKLRKLDLAKAEQFFAEHILPR